MFVCMMLMSQCSRIRNVFERKKPGSCQNYSGAVAPSAEEALAVVIVKVSIVAHDLFAQRFFNHEPALVAYS